MSLPKNQLRRLLRQGAGIVFQNDDPTMRADFQVNGASKQLIDLIVKDGDLAPLIRRIRGCNYISVFEKRPATTMLAILLAKALSDEERMIGVFVARRINLVTLEFEYIRPIPGSIVRFRRLRNEPATSLLGAKRTVFFVDLLQGDRTKRGAVLATGEKKMKDREGVLHMMSAPAVSRLGVTNAGLFALVVRERGYNKVIRKLLRADHGRPPVTLLWHARLATQGESKR